MSVGKGDFFELSLPCGTIGTPLVSEMMLHIVKGLRVWGHTQFHIVLIRNRAQRHLLRQVPFMIFVLKIAEKSCQTGCGQRQMMV